ncbi:MAG TPA: hypothetical protein VGJ05_01505 [Fimbriiglobus sp.]|jgi:hypothetical protein
MRWKTVALVACLAPAGGCHIYHNAMRIIVNEPVQYLDDQHLERQLRKDAKHAWAEVCRQYPSRTFTDDFVDGFCDGYSDYLDNGGTAQIPAVPPLRYRRSKFYNPEGRERIKQYFLGFKYGVDVAIDTGCRTFLTVPVVLPETAPPANPNITVLPSPPETSDTPLPAPRPVKDLPVGPAPKTPSVPPPVVKPPDKGKTEPDKEQPSAPIAIPLPDTTDPNRPAINAGTGQSPPVNPKPATETNKARSLFPISSPSGTEPVPPLKPTAGMNEPENAPTRTGPILDLPPARPPVELPPDKR